MESPEEKYKEIGYEADGEDVEYSSNENFSKASLAYEQFKDCMKKRSVEMKKGYFNTTLSADGIPHRTWIQDTRKIYWSSVQALRRILSPEVTDSNSDDTKKAILDIIKKMDGAYKTYAYTEYVKENKDGKIVYLREGRSYMPSIDETVNIPEQYPDGNMTMKMSRGQWNNKVNSYWEEIVLLSDMLLEELIRIIHSSNYFGGEMRFG